MQVYCRAESTGQLSTADADRKRAGAVVQREWSHRDLKAQPPVAVSFLLREAKPQHLLYEYCSGRESGRFSSSSPSRSGKTTCSSRIRSSPCNWDVTECLRREEEAESPSRHVPRRAFREFVRSAGDPRRAVGLHSAEGFGRRRWICYWQRRSWKIIVIPV